MGLNAGHLHKSFLLYYVLLNIEVNFHKNVLFMVENKKDGTRELGQEGGRKKLLGETQTSAIQKTFALTRQSHAYIK